MQHKLWWIDNKSLSNQEFQRKQNGKQRKQTTHVYHQKLNVNLFGMKNTYQYNGKGNLDAIFIFTSLQQRRLKQMFCSNIISIIAIFILFY